MSYEGILEVLVRFDELARINRESVLEHVREYARDPDGATAAQRSLAALAADHWAVVRHDFAQARACGFACAPNEWGDESSVFVPGDLGVDEALNLLHPPLAAQGQGHLGVEGAGFRNWLSLDVPRPALVAGHLRDVLRHWGNAESLYSHGCPWQDAAANGAAPFPLAPSTSLNALSAQEADLAVPGSGEVVRRESHPGEAGDSVSATDPLPILRKVSGGCHVVYGEEEGFIYGLDGMNHLLELTRQWQRALVGIPAAELDLELARQRHALRGIPAAELAEHQHPSSLNENVLDPEAIASYRQTAAALRQEGDPEQADRIEAHLKTQLGLGGRVRKTQDDTRKAADRVQKSIRRAFHTLKISGLPGAGEHFERSIKTGSEVTYRPPTSGVGTSDA